VKRRTIALGVVAVVLGVLGVYGVTAAWVAQPNQRPAVTAIGRPAASTNDGVDMDAMMRRHVEGLPADARDQARRMHEQMKASASQMTNTMQGGSGSVMNSMTATGR